MTEQSKHTKGTLGKIHHQIKNIKDLYEELWSNYVKLRHVFMNHLGLLTQRITRIEERMEKLEKENNSK